MTSTDLPDPPGLTYHRLDASAADRAEPGGPERDLLYGWGEALARGFHERRPSEEYRAIWLEAARRDGMRFSGFWPEATAVAPTSVPVATYASWTGGDLNVGTHRDGEPALLALHMITDVTVSPTHRRRGLLRSLMHRDLHDAAERGLALAALTVSEGGIYGRFGFGAATHLRSVEVDVTDRFRLRPFADTGSLELVEPAACWPVVQDVWARHVAATRGALALPAFYEGLVSGRFNPAESGPDTRTRVVVHLDETGRPDGFARYAHRGTQDGRSTVDLVSLVGLDDTAHLALWDFLAGIDLTERVRYGRAGLADPLEWALRDPRCVGTTQLRDMLWIRVLDLVGALAARPWYDDGTVVLELSDPVGLVDGRWRVAVEGGRAQVSRTEEQAGVRLDAETLGALYLGGVTTATLRAAGRIDGTAADLRRWAAMVDGGPAPYCSTGF